MKKTLLLGMLLAAGFSANAQLADGTIAPDFTVTDINGVEHNLYEYLEAGKTVVMDVSATWCGPCWNYHGTHALANLYEAYGPDASEEVMVLFVEGDPGTSVSSLYGTNVTGDNGTTQGNWTLNSPYPIIDSGAIAELYDIAYFPTVYRICSDKTVTLVDQQTITQLKNGISTDCGELEGVNNYAKLASQDVRLCENDGVVKAALTNFGGNAITSATITLKSGETVVGTTDFAGNINQFGEEEVEFSSMNFAEEGDYTVEISNINTEAPFGAEELISSMITVTPTAAVSTSNNIKMVLHTDNYPGEIGWKIRNSAGTVVESQNYTASASNKNVAKVHYITLPAGTDCFSLELIDDYGDGWVYGTAEHGMQITAGWGEEGEVLFETDGNIGKGFTLDAAVKSTGLLANETFKNEGFAIYPNPSTGLFNFATQDTVDVTVVDITGKVVHTAKGIVNGGSINLNALQSGMYIAKIKNEAGAERIEKLMVK